MSMSLRASLEHLTRGVNVLAVHPGPIRARLTAAFENHLYAVDAECLPEKSRDIWQRIQSRLATSDPSGAAGRYTASIQGLQVAEACEIAQCVVWVRDLIRAKCDEQAGSAWVRG